MLDPAIVNGAHKYIKVNALCVGASAFASVPLKRCTTGSEFVDKIRFKLDLDLAVEVHHSGQMRNTLLTASCQLKNTLGRSTLVGPQNIQANRESLPV